MFKKIIVILLLLFMPRAYAATIGSDTAVNRFNTQQILGDGDRVAGFAWLAGGFQLAGLFGTFDSFFPVSGSVGLNGRTLILSQDLIFAEVASFATLGNVVGNGHVLELAAGMKCIPQSQPIDFGNCNLNLLTSVAEGADVNAVSWSYDDQYVAAGLDSYAGTELRVYQFNGTSLTLITSVEMGVTVQAVDWHPSQYYLAVGRNASATQELLVYSFNGASLTQISQVEFGANVTAVTYHPTGNYLAVGTESNAAELVLYPVNGDGTLNTGGAVTVNLTGDADIQPQALDWDATGAYLGVGLSVTDPHAEFELYTLGFSPLSLSLTASIVGLANAVRAVSWNPVYPDIVAIGMDTLSPLLRLYSHDPATGTLTLVVSESTNLATSIRILDWRIGGECLALGKDVGAGGELRTYDYDDMAVTLSLNSDIAYADAVRGLSWSHSGGYLAVGADTNVSQIYSGLSLIPDFCPTFSDVNIMLTCNICLQNCCLRFAGNNLINGRDYNLSIKDTCTIIVDAGSNLWFKNVTLKNINRNKLGAVDSTSTYSFSRATIVMDGNTTFTRGKFDIIGDTEIQGNGFTFAYQTDAVSTVSQCGKLILDAGVTFSYAPSVASNTLLRLSEGAELILNSARLHASTAGLKLTKGELIIDGASFLSSAATSTANAIRFGDGVSAANNLCIHFMPAGTLQLLSGMVVYDNV
jgi:WD40 repeat protein